MEPEPKLRCRNCRIEIATHHSQDPAAVKWIIDKMGKLFLCRDCAEQHENRELCRARSEAWNQICPQAFRNTARSLLPYPDKIDEVMSWQYGPQGLLLYGPTTTGKTRCAWELCRREHMAGRRIAFADTYSIGIKLPSLMSRSMDEAEEYIDGLVRAHILLLDDPFKAKLTDRIEEVLFIIVSQRQDHGRPMVVTTNDTRESMMSFMSEDRGGPLVRRLRESCQPVKFLS